MTVIRASAILAVIVTSGGCQQSDRPDYRGTMQLADVSGRVTFDGKPLAGARVIFELQGAERRRSSYGFTDSGGRYTLIKARDIPGVQPGENLVRIVGAESNPDDNPNVVMLGGIPRRYNRDSDVVCTVEPLGDHTFDFELTSD